MITLAEFIKKIPSFKVNDKKDAIKTLECVLYIQNNIDKIYHAAKNMDDPKIYSSKSDFQKHVLRDHNYTSFHLNGYKNAEEVKTNFLNMISQIVYIINTLAEDDWPEFVSKFRYDKEVGCLDQRIPPAINWAIEKISTKLPNLDNLMKQYRDAYYESKQTISFFEYIKSHCKHTVCIYQNREQKLTHALIKDYLINILGEEVEEEDEEFCYHVIPSDEVLNIIQRGDALVKTFSTIQQAKFLLHQIADPEHIRPSRTTRQNTWKPTHEAFKHESYPGNIKRTKATILSKKTSSTLLPPHAKMQLFYSGNGAFGILSDLQILQDIYKQYKKNINKFVYKSNGNTNGMPSRRGQGKVGNSSTEELKHINAQNAASNIITSHNEILACHAAPAFKAVLAISDTIDSRLIALHTKYIVMQLIQINGKALDVPVIILTSNGPFPYSKEQIEADLSNDARHELVNTILSQRKLFPESKLSIALNELIKSIDANAPWFQIKKLFISLKTLETKKHVIQSDVIDLMIKYAIRTNNPDVITLLEQSTAHITNQHFKLATEAKLPKLMNAIKNALTEAFIVDILPQIEYIKYYKQFIVLQSQSYSLKNHTHINELSNALYEVMIEKAKAEDWAYVNVIFKYLIFDTQQLEKLAEIAIHFQKAELTLKIQATRLKPLLNLTKNLDFFDLIMPHLNPGIINQLDLNELLFEAIHIKKPGLVAKLCAHIEPTLDHITQTLTDAAENCLPALLSVTQTNCDTLLTRACDSNQLDWITTYLNHRTPDNTIIQNLWKNACLEKKLDIILLFLKNNLVKIDDLDNFYGQLSLTPIFGELLERVGILKFPQHQIEKYFKDAVNLNNYHTLSKYIEFANILNSQTPARFFYDQIQHWLKSNSIDLVKNLVKFLVLRREMTIIIYLLNNHLPLELTPFFNHNFRDWRFIKSLVETKLIAFQDSDIKTLAVRAFNDPNCLEIGFLLNFSDDNLTLLEPALLGPLDKLQQLLAHDKKLFPEKNNSTLGDSILLNCANKAPIENIKYYLARYKPALSTCLTLWHLFWQTNKPELYNFIAQKFISPMQNILYQGNNKSHWQKTATFYSEFVDKMDEAFQINLIKQAISLSDLPSLKIILTNSADLLLKKHDNHFFDALIDHNQLAFEIYSSRIRSPNNQDIRSYCIAHAKRWIAETNDVMILLNRFSTLLKLHDNFGIFNPRGWRLFSRRHTWNNKPISSKWIALVNECRNKIMHLDNSNVSEEENQLFQKFFKEKLPSELPSHQPIKACR